MQQIEKKNKQQRLQTILRLIEEYPIKRQEELIAYLAAEGYAVTQATISRDIRELNLIKASAENGYRYVSGRSADNAPRDGRATERFETIFRESVLKVDYAGHTVVVKCYTGMANAACGVFDSLCWDNVVGTLSGDDTFFILTKTERDARTVTSELSRYITRH